MNVVQTSTANRARKMPTRWIRWIVEASATDMPMPWSNVRPPRGGGIRALCM